MGLSSVVHECPACGQGYELAFTIHDWHVCHPIPFIKRPGDPISEARMNSPMAMATSGEPRTFICETVEAFDHVTRLQRAGKIEPLATIRMASDQPVEKQGNANR
ncbi:MAG: hypothetical protein GYA24_18650 [Candidatus Lokiarchaeota archaeon]|nr:hypothetical protein [Candidatus Lokiarchaeota archaeon]